MGFQKIGGKVNTNPLLKETFIFRPLKEHHGMLRYADGSWIPDDGQPDLAFIYRDTHPVVEYVRVPYYTNLLWQWNEIIDHRGKWHYCTTDNEHWDAFYFDERKQHPNEVASDSGMSKCCDMFGCANGESISIIEDNDYIKQGRLIIKSTGEPVRKPDNPVCFLCLNNEYGHRLQKLQRQKEEIEANIENYTDEIRRAESDLADAQDSLERTNQQLVEVNDLLKIIQEERKS